MLPPHGVVVACHAIQLSSPLNLDSPPVDPFAAVPDMGAFEMDVALPRIEPLPPMPAVDSLGIPFMDWGDPASPEEADRISGLGECTITPF